MTEREAVIERAKACEAEYFANPIDGRFSSDMLADFALSETESLRAENERLRAALEHIRDMPVYDQDDHVRIRHAAHRSLEPSEKITD